MAAEVGRVSLPLVEGWPPPPPVTVPIYEIAAWSGPKWLVLYDGTDDHRGLRLVHFVYAEPNSQIDVAGIITFAKQPAEDLGDGFGIAATDLSSVADYALMQLLDRLPHRTKTRQERRAWEIERFDELSTGVVEPPGWAHVCIQVEGSQLAGHQANVDQGSAICIDAGEVFIGIYFTQPLPVSLVLQSLVNLSSYPMPSEAVQPQLRQE